NVAFSLTPEPLTVPTPERGNVVCVPSAAVSTSEPDSDCHAWGAKVTSRPSEAPDAIDVGTVTLPRENGLLVGSIAIVLMAAALLPLLVSTTWSVFDVPVSMFPNTSAGASDNIGAELDGPSVS